MTTPFALDPHIQQALARRFERIVVFSGAGMSADSGITTFRSGGNGLWQAFDPQQLATPQAWQRDRDLVWGWYEWRRGLVMQATPNAGHLTVAQLQQSLGAQVVTQNVDDLHERAGVSDLLHLHGSLFAPRCSDCDQPQTLPPLSSETRQRLPPPRCTQCGGAVRPGIVWFGEGLDEAIWAQAQQRIAACDLLLVVGTSGVVQPAASLIGLAPREALVVEINPLPCTDAGHPILRLRMSAAEGLPALAHLLLTNSR